MDSRELARPAIQHGPAESKTETAPDQTETVKPGVFSRTFKAFQYREFRTMWIGACLSSIGTWMQQLAQSWLVYQISGSSTMLGVDAFLGQAPIVLLSLFGGVVADRVDRRYVLLGSQLLQLTCAFVLTGLVITNTVQVWHIFCLSTLVGIAQAFGGPAYQAFVPTMVAPEDMPNAIALNSIQFNLARVIGPTIGGLVMAKLGAAWCFGLNGLSYVAVIITLLMVKGRFTPKASRESILKSMGTGFQFVRAHRTMLTLMVLAFLLTFLGAPTITFLPVFAKNVFAKDAETLSVLMAVSGLGSVLGALLLATFGHTKNKGRLAIINMLALGLLVAAFSQSTYLPLACFFLFFASAALMSVFALVNSLVQLEVTDEMRGRVMSVYNMSFRGGMPVGNLLSGQLIDRGGAPAVIATNGLLLVITAVYFYFFRRKVSEI
jgi:predicted MFS family arabinose efflux permease